MTIVFIILDLVNINSYCLSNILISVGEDAMDQSETDVIEIPEEHVTKLEGHKSEVFICSWNPTTNLLASGYARPHIPRIRD